MSDYIPLEIQAEIIQKLPIKSFHKFKSASKPWKSLICSSKFIYDYHVIHLTQPQDHHLLIRHTGPADDNSVERYVSIVDDDVTFPCQKSPLIVPMPVKLLNRPKKIVSSQGLSCLYCPKACTITKDYPKTAVIWNPTVGKSVCIDVPNVLDLPYETVIGFGVRPDTCDPTLFKVSFDSTSLDTDTFVELFTLSTNAWRKVYINLPRKEIAFTQNPVAVGKFIYWYAFDSGFHWNDLIVSFDMTTQEFTDICLLDNLQTYDLNISLHISKLSESLVVVQSKREAVRKPVYTVWKMMEHGVKNLFTKIITTYTPDSLRDTIRLHGFRMSGEHIVEIINALGEDALFVYEPN